MIIGSAEIIVSPITRGFEGKLRNQLRDIQGTLGGFGRRMGQGLGESFSEGVKNSLSDNVFGKVSDGLLNMAPNAEFARQKFQTLVRVGYTLQAVLGTLVGGISSLVVSLGTLIGVLGRAAPAVAVLANAFVLLRTAMAVAKFGFGDIASAVKQATEPTNAMGKSIADLREEFQQLIFDAEQATNSEARAALNLEDALNNLKRVQDLPPNSRARREAQLAYDEADLAYRRAKDRAADLNEEVGKGQDEFIKKNKEAAGNDPFAALNDAQTEFAKRLIELKPLLDELEEDISEAFLPPLDRALTILVDDIYPVLKRRLPEVAKQTGEAIEGIVGGLDEEKVENILRQFTTPFEAGGRSNIQLFGDLLNNVLDIFLQIVEATAPLLNDFLTFLVDKTDEWGRKLEETDLVAFFEGAGEYAGGLGEVIGNVFVGLGNLIGLTTGPGSAGESMLEWMKNGTAEFRNMFSEDPEAGKKFFSDAFENARLVMSSIGALLEQILKLADNPNIGETFKTLEEGAPALGEMLGKMVDAGPSFAEFLKTVTEIANSLTDSDQISAFFDTLNAGAEIFQDFVDSGPFKRLLDNLGPTFATLSAVGVIFDVFKFGFDVVVGYLVFILAKAAGFFTMLKTGAASIGKFLISPFGIVIGIFVLLITKAVQFYDKFVDFRAMVDNVFAGVRESFERFLEPLSELGEKIFGGEGGGGLMGALDPLIKAVLERLIPAIGFILELFFNLLALITDIANEVMDYLLPVFEDIGSALGKLMDGDILGFLGDLGSAVLSAAGNFAFLIGNIFIDMINFGIRAINSMIGLITNGPFGDFMRDVFGVDLSNVKLKEIERMKNLTEQRDIVQERNRINDALGAGAAGGLSFGGPDRLAARNATSASLNALTTSKIEGSSQYGNWKEGGGLTINQTNNYSGGDPREQVENSNRGLGYAIRQGAS
jgi:hypothetical protein